MIRHCDTCNEKLAAFKFEGDSQTCRTCTRWSRKPAQPIDVKAHHSAIGQLRHLPEYRKYVDEWTLRRSQFGMVQLRGVGHVD